MRTSGAFPRGTPLDFPLALFLAGALTGLACVYDRSLAWPTLAALTGGLLLYYGSAWLGFSERGGRILALLLVAVGSGLAIYFVSQFGHLDYPVKSHLMSQMGRTLSQVMPRLAWWQPQPNYVAAFLEGVLPLALALVLGSAEPWLRGLGTLACLTMVAALLLSVSRGAWVALALTASLAIGLRWPRWGILLGGLAVAVLLYIVGYLLLGGGASLDSMPVVGSLVASLLVRPDRWAVWRGSFHLIQDFPFTGIGLGKAFPMIYARYVLLIAVPFLTYSHNLWLEVWLQQGVLGAIGFVWLVIAFYLSVIRTYRMEAAKAHLFQGAWLGVTAMLVHGLFDAAHYAALWVFLAFFAVLGLAVAGTSRPEREVCQQPRRTAIAVVAIVVLLAAAGLVAWRPLTGGAYVNRGALRQAWAELAEGTSEEERAALLAAAKADYELGLEVNPQSRPAHQRLGMLAMDAGRYAEAVDYLEAALPIDPANATTHKALGLAYVWVGRLEEAEPLLAQVPNIVEELNVWGWWRGSQGELELARNAYQMSLRLDPDQDAVQRALSEISG